MPDSLSDLVLHVDSHLNEWVGVLGPWIYLLLFIIIFCETGLVVTPFLPGDSLLFALGALAATEGAALSLPLLAWILIGAGIAGDTVNYAAGRWVGPRIFQREGSWWFRKDHLLRTQRYYERHGGKTIVIARFMPILRTFAPFVAGIGQMHYRRFALFNISGAVAWVLSFLLGGYFFGNLPMVKRNFHIVIGAIIVLSCLPAAIQYLKQRTPSS